jgi:hypothetical protein
MEGMSGTAHHLQKTAQSVATDQAPLWRTAIIFLGLALFLLPTWIALVWLVLARESQQSFNELMHSLGSRTFLFHAIPLSGGATAAVCTRLSNQWKFGIVLALIPLLIVQYMAIFVLLGMLGHLPL